MMKYFNHFRVAPGTMPIEAAKAADIAMAVQPLHSQMSEQEVMDRLRRASEYALPVVDLTTGRMIGVIMNKQCRRQKEE